MGFPRLITGNAVEKLFKTKCQASGSHSQEKEKRMQLCGRVSSGLPLIKLQSVIIYFIFCVRNITTTDLYVS